MTDETKCDKCGGTGLIHFNVVEDESLPRICLCAAGKRVDFEYVNSRRKIILDSSIAANPQAYAKGSGITRPPAIKLMPDAKTVVVLDYKCRKCGIKMEKSLQLTVTVLGEDARTKMILHLFKDHEFMIHHCENVYEGFEAIADCLGGSFYPAIHTSGLITKGLR